MKYTINKYTFQDYFPEYIGDRVNDETYQKEAAHYLNSIHNSLKLQEALAGFRENPPDKMHFCSNQGCDYCHKVIKEMEK